MSLYITLIILFLVVAIFFRVDFVFYIIYVCVAMWIWSRWVIPRQLKRISVTRHYPHRVFWNERFTVELHIQNSGWLSLPWLQLRESVPLELRFAAHMNTVLSLRGREKTQIKEEFIGKRRGRHQIGPLSVSTGDLFGLGTLQTVVFPADDVIVYPRIHSLKSLGLPSKLPFGTLPSEERLFADPSRPMGVREYRSGDSLRTMNWKVSAHTRKLMVRTYQPAVAQQVLIALNLYEPDFSRKDHYAYIEWSIELAASLAAHLIQQKQEVVLAPPPEAIHQGPSTLSSEKSAGRAGAEVILEKLAQIELQTETTLAEWLPHACREVQWGTTILVITPTVSTRITEILHQLVRTGRNPVLIISQPLSDKEQLALYQRARQLGFVVYYVPRVTDLAVWQFESPGKKRLPDYHRQKQLR